MLRNSGRNDIMWVRKRGSSRQLVETYLHNGRARQHIYGSWKHDAAELPQTIVNEIERTADDVAGTKRQAEALFWKEQWSAIQQQAVNRASGLPDHLRWIAQAAWDSSDVAESVPKKELRDAINELWSAIGEETKDLEEMAPAQRPSKSPG